MTCHPDHPSRDAASDSTAPRPCLVVAIGASAGGQQALEQFFTSIPHDCQLSFVVVMHIPPAGPSFLAETLSRYTSMPVTTAADDMQLDPDTVFVIPAGRELTVQQGRLRLHAPSGNHNPIDRLLDSLARDVKEHTVAVILSGLGSDGTLGVEKVKEAGGMVLVQEPASALNASMPESAIATGAADWVLPPEEMPAKVAEIAHGNCPLPACCCHHTSLDEELQAIFAIVKARTGHDFSSYKKSTLIRRIERRMAVHEVAGMKKYLAILEKETQEAEALGQEVLIGVTSFFRDRGAFQLLAREVVPRLFAGRDPDDPVRIWHACCASGEEVYSTAMLILEYLGEQRLEAKVQLFATDIDEAAIAQARVGLYDDETVAEVGEERLQRFFVRVNGRWQVSKQLREMVVFAHHSLIKDPPFSRLDLLVCRNFLIYLNPDLQSRLMALFHLALKPKGVLFLGASETVGRAGELFTPLDKKWKFYERREGSRRREAAFPLTSSLRRLAGPPRPQQRGSEEGSTLGSAADRVLAQLYAPPCVVVNEKYEVVHVPTGASRFLALPVGGATLEILKMAREELRPALRAAIYKCFSDQQPVAFKGLKVSDEQGESTVNLVVRPLAAEQGENLALVVLENGGSSPATLPAGETRLPEGEASRDALVRQLEEQLRVTDEQLQVTTEQLETSREGFLSANEELMSINEEFQSANEELHSANEELETSREELQALNEELVTVNAELQGKLEELDRTNSDMENLLASSAIATLFLDRELHIKRFTAAAAAIFNLIPADLGRPFRHLAGTIDWPGLPSDLAGVLETERPVEREVAGAGNGRCYLMGVLPYRSAGGGVDGVVVTLVDITEHKRLEEETLHLASFPEQNPNPVLEVDLSGRVTFANPAVRWTLQEVGLPADDLTPFLPADLGLLVEGWDRSDNAIHYREVALHGKVYGETIFLSRQFQLTRIYAFDLTDLKRTEEKIRRGKEEWERTFDSVPDLIAIMDAGHRMVRVNRAMADRLGLSPRECVGGLCHLSVHGDDSPPCHCPHLQTLADGREHQAEVYEERLGGYFLVTTTPLFDRDGVMTGTVHVARDITERKRTEEAHARLAAIVESSEDAIIAKGLDGIILTWNSGAEKMFGYTAQEAVGQPMAMLVPDELRREEQQILERLAAGGSVNHFESRRLAKDGRQIEVSLTASPILNGEGKVIGVSKIARDITGRKRDEEKIREQSAVVQGINEIFEAALASVSEEELGKICLAVAEKVTGSRLGFICERLADGLLHNIAISNQEWDSWEPCDRHGERRTLGSFQLHGLYGRAFTEGKGFFTNEPASHPDRVGLPEGHPPLTAFLAVPLVNQGEVTGVLALGNRSGGYRTEELKLLEAVAPAVMEAFLRKRAENASKTLLARREELLAASVRITSQTTMEGLLDTVAEAARRLTGGRYCAAGHGYLGGKFVTGGASRAEDALPCPPGQLFNVQRGGVYLELINGSETLRLGDAEMRAHPAWWGLPEEHVPMRGLLGARLTDAAGKPNGIIMVSDKGAGGDFSAEDEATLRQLALIASLALQHIEAAAEVLERVDELERFNTASVGRELRIIQIKKEVNELCGGLGLPPRYTQGLDEDQP